MTEQLIHPGLLPADQRSFNLYARFINPNGLSTDLFEWFKTSLQRFYLHTNSSPVWMPYNCRYVDAVLPDLLEACYPAIAEIKRFDRSHYWFELGFESPRIKLIVDPAGAIRDKKALEKFSPFQLAELYQPYFGLKDSATGLHRDYYMGGEGLDEYGTDIPDEILREFSAA